VQAGETTSASSGPPARAESPANEGVIVLAAPIDPQPLTYVPITETLPITYTLLESGADQMSEEGGQEPAPGVGNMEMAVWQPPVGVPDMRAAQTLWVNPVELLAALNAENQALTLVLMPDIADPYVTSGLSLTDLVPLPVSYEEVLP
jgi:hypothetical protein